jgi:hypothetical protein
VQNGQLRFFLKSGQLVPTLAEIAETLAAQLRELGIEPNA